VRCVRAARNGSLERKCEMKKLLLLFILIGLYSQLSSASDDVTEKSLTRARVAFEQQDYETAIEKYESLLESDVLSNDDRNEALYRLGISYEKEEEIRDAAYFYGEFVRINRMDHPNFKEALYKAGSMNLMNATGKKDQSFSRSAILYFSHFLELFFEDERASRAEQGIERANDYIAEFHYSQHATLSFKKDNYCGAFISFNDSLEASDKYLEEIIVYAQDCQRDKSCRKAMKSCFEIFGLDHISAFEVIKPE
jgi:outer membrane protein assembly factor BamD (BamD/ComL family)